MRILQMPLCFLQLRITGRLLKSILEILKARVQRLRQILWRDFSDPAGIQY